MCDSDQTHSDAKQKSAKKPSYRGKASVSKHQDKFRSQTNSAVMAANDARIESRLFSHLTQLSSKIQSFSHDVQPVSSTIPQTTRGIGFTSALSYNFLNIRKPIIGFTVHQLYRTSLAFHHYQCMKAAPYGSRFRPLAPYRETIAEPFNNFSLIVEAHPRTFNAVSGCLSGFGNIDVNGETYLGYLPPPQSTYYVEGPATSASSASSDQSLSGKSKKKRKQPTPGLPGPAEGVQRAVHSQLNPYTVNLQNLRTVVHELSDVNVPVALRRYFRERNPIPGAIWEGDLLVNADDIMPNQYGQAQLSADFRALDAAIDIASKRYASCFTTVNLSGKAAPTTFVNVFLHGQLVRENNSDELIIRQEEYVASKKISSNHFLLGVISLCGETYDGCPEMMMRTYGPRRMQSGVCRLDVDYNQLLESLYQ